MINAAQIANLTGAELNSLLLSRLDESWPREVRERVLTTLEEREAIHEELEELELERDDLLRELEAEEKRTEELRNRVQKLEEELRNRVQKLEQRDSEFQRNAERIEQLLRRNEQLAAALTR